jgi:hypothetical protein
MLSDSLPLMGEELDVTPEIQRPTLITTDTVTHALPAFPMSLEPSVLNLNTRSLGRLRDEANLPFTDFVGICFDLPMRADIPGALTTIDFNTEVSWGFVFIRFPSTAARWPTYRLPESCSKTDQALREAQPNPRD